MITKRLKARVALGILLMLLLGSMYAITTYPFDLFIPNEVQWIEKRNGVYFNGSATASTTRCRENRLTGSISVQLLLKERYGSKNWGPRYIFSIYNGPGDPPLVVGQWSGKIFVYSRYAKSKNSTYYQDFTDTLRLPLNKAQLITVTLDQKEMALYINGRLAKRRIRPDHPSGSLNFAGRYMVGNSPRGRQGWFGEVNGLAVFSRILSKEEIREHSDAARESGIRALQNADSLVALYPFNEGRGRTAQNALNGQCAITFPKTRYSLAGTLLNLPFIGIHTSAFIPIDFLMNILFFIPMGVIVFMILRTFQLSNTICISLVVLAAAIVSLSIELMQLYLLTRVATIVDIAGNVFGGIIGGVLEAVRRRLMQPKKPRVS